MMDDEFTRWESQIRDIAKEFTYPETPDMVVAWQKRPFPTPTPFFLRPQLGRALLVLLVLFAGLIAVPQVRAAVVKILRAGAITIFVQDETVVPETAVSSPTTTPELANEFLFALAEPVTLEMAQESAAEPLSLPTYPANLGLPDQVYLSDPGNYAFIVSVWLNPEDRSQPMLSLYQIEAAQFAQKGADSVELTEVNGNTAFWIEGEHVFRLADGRFQSWLFVEGNVLLWWLGNVTYRLEGATSLAEAIRIAESLQPIE